MLSVEKLVDLGVGRIGLERIVEGSGVGVHPAALPDNVLVVGVALDELEVD